LSNVFERLHRLRHLEERAARVEHVARARERDEQLAQVIELEQRVERSRAAIDDTPSLQHRDAWLLHAEMDRRRRDAELTAAQRRFTDAEVHLRHRAVEARSVELLAEGYEARLALAFADKERRELDEIGSQRWMRRAS